MQGRAQLIVCAQQVALGVVEPLHQLDIAPKQCRRPDGKSRARAGTSPVIAALLHPVTTASASAHAMHASSIPSSRWGSRQTACLCHSARERPARPPAPACQRSRPKQHQHRAARATATAGPTGGTPAARTTRPLSGWSTATTRTTAGSPPDMVQCDRYIRGSRRDPWEPGAEMLPATRPSAPARHHPGRLSRFAGDSPLPV
jgi:hypothetical protein